MSILSRWADHGRRVAAGQGRILPLLLALALVKGLIWSIVLPAWSAPDEPSHYSYVQVMVEDHRLAQGPDFNAGGYYAPEIGCSESNLGWGLSGPFYTEPPFGGPWGVCRPSEPADRHALNALNAAGNYSPLYYAGAIPLYLAVYAADVDTRMHAVRLWSVVLGVLATLFAFLAAGFAFPPGSRLATAAAVLFTVQPMNSQQLAVVNNDAMLIAVAAAFWWRFFRALRIAPSLFDFALLGGLAGLAYVAKPQGVFLLAALPILVLIDPGKATTLARRFLFPGLVAGAAAAILIGLGAVLTVLAHTSLGLRERTPGIHGLRAYWEIYSANHWQHAYWLWVTTFWGYFGWFQVDLPDLGYDLILLAVVAGLVGAVLGLLRRRGSRAVAVAAGFGILAPAALIQLLELYTFRLNATLILQGRSFLMLLLPVAVLLVWGWSQLAGERRPRAVAGSVILASLALNAFSLMLMLEAYYG